MSEPARNQRVTGRAYACCDLHPGRLSYALKSVWKDSTRRQGPAHDELYSGTTAFQQRCGSCSTRGEDFQTSTSTSSNKPEDLAVMNRTTRPGLVRARSDPVRIDISTSTSTTAFRIRSSCGGLVMRARARLFLFRSSRRVQHTNRRKGTRSRRRKAQLSATTSPSRAGITKQSKARRELSMLDVAIEPSCGGSTTTSYRFEAGPRRSRSTPASVQPRRSRRAHGSEKS